MDDVTIVKAISDRIKQIGGADPLVPEAAAGPSATALCRAAFNAILNGKLLAVSELAKSTGASSQDVERLVGRALIVDERGRVVAAHGLPAVPARQHRMTLRGRPFWTCCAIDALGIPAGLGEDAVAETTCQLCATAVRVEFKAGKVMAASHAAARVWDAQRLEGRGTAGPRRCALMSLFCSAEHLAEWRPPIQANRAENGTMTEWASSVAPSGASCTEVAIARKGRKTNVADDRRSFQAHTTSI